VPVITSAGATAFCDGGSVTLHVSNILASGAYTWLHDGQPTTVTTSSYGTTVGGSYTVMVTDANGCTVTSLPQTVTVHPLPVVAIVPAGATTLCDGESVTLHANTPVSCTYQWYQNGQPESTSSDMIATAAGSYIVTVADINGCTATSHPQTVTVNPLPSVPVITPTGVTEFCDGGSVTLTAYAPEATAYEWYKDNQPLAGALFNTCVASTTGDYSVVAVNSHGCRSQQPSATLRVTVYKLPETPVIVANPPFYVGFKYVLKIQSPEESVLYSWYKDGQYTGSNEWQFPLPALQVGDVQIYFVEVIDAHDCRSRSADFICTAEISPLFIPNVFTPNNDGVNDNFHIAGLEAFIENELQIINNRGQLVYSKKNYYNEWYGGDQLTDTYYYYLTVTDKQGIISRYTGFVHLKR
jgi:gliding motility-associated-like protein